MNRLAAVLALALALAPALATAQEPGHEHMTGAGMAMVLHDGPDGGRAAVGDYTHFGFALLNNSQPQTHRNAAFLVEQNGVVVFQTNDTHEYDGLFSFDHRFTEPGPYTVTASSEGMTTGVFHGEVVMPVNETVAKVTAKIEPLADARLVKVTVSIVDPAGAIIPHTDAIVEFRDASAEALIARFHVHIHDAPIVFTEALPPDPVVMSVTGYKADPTGRSTDVQAVVGSFRIEGSPGTPGGIPAAPHAPAPLKPLGAKAEKGGYVLWASYDPEPQIAPGSTVRLVGTILNASGMPQPHVDFDINVNGPQGLLFASKSFHEYDGVAEYEIQPFVPGFYDGTITANTDDAGGLTVPLHFEVVPPAIAALPGDVAAGPFTVSVKGLQKVEAGVPVELTFDVSGPQGPSQHSEVDVTIDQKGQAPLYNFKLHTHESGQTKATVVFPSAGDWRIRIDALPTAPEPSIYVGPNGPNAPILFAAKVAAGSSSTTDVKPSTQSNGAKPVPGVGAICVLGAAAVALALVRRRA